MTQSAQRVEESSRRSYSLRHRLDLVAGGLLLFIALGSCLALGLTQHQQRHMRFLEALHEQERLIYELSLPTATSDAERSTTDASAAYVHSVLDGLDRLQRNLQTMQTGGLLQLSDGDRLSVHPLKNRLANEHLSGALLWIERYRARFNEFVGAQPAMSPQTRAVVEREVSRHGRDLQTFIQGIATATESQSLAEVVRASWLQLVLIFIGTLCFLGGVVFLRRLVTTPLHRMADGIEAMRRTGRLVKLPVMHANELGVVAAGFNHLAEEVEEQKRRLREHIVELQRVNVELDQLANLKDDFLAMINHQLRSPLTAITEGLELIRDGTMGPVSLDQQTLLDAMGRNTEQLTNLVENALDLSMLKSGRRPLKRQPDNLAAVLRQTHTSWQEVARSCTINVSSEELPPVYMDAPAIQDVMDHLLRNALRHAPERSTVLVEAHVRNGFAEVSVCDQGPGLSSEQLSRLFQPFVHLQTPDAPGSQGSGLGLAFCRQVIERHHGTIQAQSAEGRGTTMTFTLPIASATFLFEEACRVAREEAAHEHGQFGLLLIGPQDPAASTAVADLMHQAEAVLRRNTHRGDQFVWVDDATLVIMAVTDHVGLEAMARRLRGLMEQAKLDVQLSSAHAPTDGDRPAQLLEAARHRGTAPHRTIMGSLHSETPGGRGRR